MSLFPAFVSFLCGSALLCGVGVCVGAVLAAPTAASDDASPAPQPVAAAPKAETQRVYVGTYTQNGGKGIYLFRFDLASGKLTPDGTGPETTNPSFLVLAPNHQFLYAINEVGTFGGKPSGSVSAFAVDPDTGALTLLNQQPSGGTGPCHLAVDKAGKNVLVANYSNGNVAVLPIMSNGHLGQPTAVIHHTGSGTNPQRQEGPHAHCVALDAANRFAFSTDLGLDKVFVYHFNAHDGTLLPNTPPAAEVAPGSGPRHFTFHPNGRYAYLINEMKSTVAAFTYDADAGTLQEIQTVSTLPDGFQGSNTAAEIQVSPNGKFLYGSNRGDDSIVIYAIDPDTGRLTLAGHQSTQGKNPRNFCIDPTGTYLLAANQDSNNIVVFRIDPQTGLLTPTGNTADVPMPVCVQIVSAGASAR